MPVRLNIAIDDDLHQLLKCELSAKGDQPLHQERDLCALFGVSQSAGAAKSREVTRPFDIVPFNPRWTLPSRLVENPLVWMIPVNGVIVDIRMMPRELQKWAHELGLIPFVPATHGKADGAS